MTQPAAALVLDEHLMALRTGLDKRGMKTLTVRDFKATSTLDPDVMRAVAGGMAGAPWVLLTMDLTIVEDYRKFEWERYAIAWIAIDSHIRGIAAEYAKADVSTARAPIRRATPGRTLHVHTAPAAPITAVPCQHAPAEGPLASLTANQNRATGATGGQHRLRSAAIVGAEHGRAYRGLAGQR